MRLCRSRSCCRTFDRGLAPEPGAIWRSVSCSNGKTVADLNEMAGIHGQARGDSICRKPGTFRLLIHLRTIEIHPIGVPFGEEICCMGMNVHALELTRSVRGSGKPDRAEVEAAVRTIIRWSGDDPARAGLIETPARVARALEEAFAGYDQDPAAVLRKSFDEIEGYDEMVVLRGVRFESRCEHHLAPIVGRAWVAYVPDGRVVGTRR